MNCGIKVKQKTLVESEVWGISGGEKIDSLKNGGAKEGSRKG